MKFFHLFLAKRVLSVTVLHVLQVAVFFFFEKKHTIFFVFWSCSAPVSHIACAHLFSQPLKFLAQAFCLYESTRYGLEDLSCVAMSPPSKRKDEIESWSSASTVSAPKRIHGSAGRAGFEAGLVMNSHCFTWQNASLKEPDEDNKRYLWRMPTPVESEPMTAPSPVGPIALWRAAMVTKYDLMIIEFDRDGKNWTITQRNKHYSVTRMILRDRPQNAKFMLVVTEPPNVSTREVIEISNEFTEVTALSYGARALIELVPLQGWLKRVKSNPTKPSSPVLPTLPCVNETLIVETDESGKEVDAQNVHDEVVIVIEENRNNEASSSSSGNKVDVVDNHDTSIQCDETSEVTSNVDTEGKTKRFLRNVIQRLM